MSSGTGLAMGSDGRLVVVKRAAPGPPSQRLRREAGMLRRAVHPGVVELVDDGTDGDGASISTAFVGGGTLADFAAGADLRLVVRALAAVATTLADLHDRGITHGRVTSDHILMADDGYAVLCGLAEASDTGTSGNDSGPSGSGAPNDRGAPSSAGATNGRGAPAGTDPVAADPAGTDPAGADPARANDDVGTVPSAARDIDSMPADDVAALASLVQEVAAGGTGPQVAPLQRIAERALAPDPAVRPSMRQLATSLRNLDPTPSPAAPALAAGPRLLVARSPRGRTRWPRGAVAVVVVIVAAVAVTMATRVTMDRPPSEEAAAGDTAAAGNNVTTADPTPPAVMAPATPSTTSSLTPGTSPATSSSMPTDGPSQESTDGSVPPSPAGPPAVRIWPAPTSGTAPVDADVDGDGNSDAVDVAGGIVTAAGIRWQVAAPEEIVVVGDWDCDGRPTPAVVRPGSGQVWAYSRWADDGESVSAAPAGVVPGASTATTVHAGDDVVDGEAVGEEGCDTIEVTDATGGSTVVVPPR